MLNAKVRLYYEDITDISLLNIDAVIGKNIIMFKFLTQLIT